MSSGRSRTTAAADRAWATQVRRFEHEHLSGARVGEAWRRRIAYEVARTPHLLRRAGVDRPPRRPSGVRARHIEALKQQLPWSPATFTLHFAALRRLLRWARNPLALDAGIWAVASGVSGRRRWLTPEQMTRLYRSARGSERVLLALEGFNGLRRVEVLRLRRADLDFDRNRLRVLGKGRHGGKWRTLPLFPETALALRGLGPDRKGTGLVMPLSRSGADLMLRSAADRAGFPREGLRVSHHDLRRTFGRLAHKAGMDLVQLKNLYGHSSLDQTVHYIGLDEDEMRAGLERLAQFLRPMLDPATGRANR